MEERSEEGVEVEALMENLVVVMGLKNTDLGTRKDGLLDGMRRQPEGFEAVMAATVSAAMALALVSKCRSSSNY